MNKLSEIQILIKNSKYSEALMACDDLLQKQPELLFEVLRQKSHLYSRQAMYKLAVNELSQIIVSGRGKIGDFHSAAFWASYDGQFERALDWYLTALKMGEDQDETWFQSSALHMIAYIYMELGEFDKANLYLDKDESFDQESSFLIPHRGFCDIRRLRNEISRRERRK